MPVLKARIGGTWVDVGGGTTTSEVEIGTADPIATNPAAELWYDTDEPAVLSSDLRWNTAWGVVSASSNAGAVTTSGTTELRLLFVPAFDAVAGRRYKITAEFVVGASVSVDNFRFVIRRGSTTAGTLVKVGPSFSAQTSGGFHVPIVVICQYDVPGTVAGMQYACCVARMSGTGTLTMVDSNTNGVTNSMIVEDIGPSTGATPILTLPDQLVGCRVSSAVQLIPTNANTEFSFVTETSDTSGFFTSPSTTVTVPAGLGGMYQIGGGISAAANTGTDCYTDVKINNGVIQRFPARINASPPFPAVLYYLVAGDTVKLSVFHTAGVSVNCSAYLSLVRLGTL